MVHLRARYSFWQMLNGVVVSAEVGALKPSPIIYQHLLTTYQLNAQETLFIDDHKLNVEGAPNKSVCMPFSNLFTASNVPTNYAISILLLFNVSQPARGE